MTALTESRLRGCVLLVIIRDAEALSMAQDAPFYLNLGLLTLLLAVALVVYTRVVIKPTLKRYG